MFFIINIAFYHTLEPLLAFLRRYSMKFSKSLPVDYFLLRSGSFCYSYMTLLAFLMEVEAPYWSLS